MYPARRIRLIIIFLLLLIFGLLGYLYWQNTQSLPTAKSGNLNVASLKTIDDKIAKAIADLKGDKFEFLSGDELAKISDYLEENGLFLTADYITNNPDLRGLPGATGATGTTGSTGSTGSTGVTGASVGTCAYGNCISLQATTPGTQETGNMSISGTGLFGGNVGIGTTAPTTTFQIAPTTTATGPHGLMDVSGTVDGTTINQRAIYFGPTVTASGNGAGAVEIQPILAPSSNIGTMYGTINLARFDGTSNITNAYANFYRLDTVGTYTGTITDGYGLLLATPSLLGTKPTTVYGMRIQNQGIAGSTTSYGLFVNTQAGATNSYSAIFQGGNVGIGTTSPLAPLHISTALDVSAAPDAKGLLLEQTLTTSQKWLLSVGVSGISNRFFAIRNVTAGTYPLIIDNNSGNIGIGTATVGKKLDVNGDIRIRGDLATLNFYRDTSPSDIAYIQYSEAGGSFGINANNKTFNINNGLSFANTFSISNTGATVSIPLGRIATGGTTNPNTFAAQIQITSANNSYFTGGGNVGIGTTSPTAGKLQVAAPSSGTALAITGIFTDGTVRNSGIFSSANPLTFTPSATPTLQQSLIDGIMVFSGTVGSSAAILPISADLRLQGSGTLGNLGNYNPIATGGLFHARTISPFSGTITGEFAGAQFKVSHTAGAGTVNKMAGIQIASPGYTAGGTVVGPIYGARIANQGNAAWATSYGLHIDAQSGSTNSYAAIFEGGNVGIGTTTPTNTLTVVGTGSFTDLFTKTTPVYDVRAYASVQAAIDAASTAGGGTVQPVPNTTYTGAITLKANVTLRCVDRSTVFTIANAANTDVITVNGSNTQIINCTIDGNSANQTTLSRGIQIGSDISNFLAENIEVRFTRDDGINLGGATGAISNITIRNSYLHDTGTYGVNSRGVTNLKIQNNFVKAFAVRTTTADAFFLQLGAGGSANTNVSITDNVVQNTVSTYFGVESAGVSYAQIVVGCNISDNTWDAGGLNASGISGFFFNCSMTGNTHLNGTGSHRSGYEIVGTGNTISGNTIINGTITIAGSTGASGHAVVSDNYIRNDSANGVGIADASGVMIGGGTTAITDVTVTGNEIHLTNASPQSGIYLGTYGTTVQINRIKVTANKVYCSAGGGSGIRLLASAGTSDIDVETNTVKGCVNGWLDNSVSGNYNDITLINNDLHGNTTAINHNFTGGSWRNWGNITAAGQTVQNLNGGATVDSTGMGSFNGGLLVTSGNVGIGDTNPLNTLKVVGSLCVKSTIGACAGTVSGTIYATNTTVQAADLAENYVSSQTLEPGDLVIPANDGNNLAVVKSTATYQKQLIGVVSTNPGVTLNSDAKTDSAHPNMYPLALSGRVPVKVTVEGGSIAVGDYLTSSSTPGVAMKATRPGQIIGKALESFSTDGIGKIMVYVNTSFADPQEALAQFSIDSNGNVVMPANTTASTSTYSSNQGSSSAPSGQDTEILNLKSSISKLDSKVASLEASLNIFASNPSTSASPSAQLGLAAATLDAEDLSTTNATVSGTLNVAGRTVLSDVGITGKMNIGLLAIEGLSENGFATLNTTSGPLMLQSDGLNGIDILAGKVTIEPDGDMKVSGNLTVKKLNIDTEDVASASLGEGIIKEGNSRVEIKTKSMTDKSKVFVTATSDVDFPLIVSEKKSGESFSIKVKLPVAADVKFDWWIVN